MPMEPMLWMHRWVCHVLVTNLDVPGGGDLLAAPEVVRARKEDQLSDGSTSGSLLGKVMGMQWADRLRRECNGQTGLMT